MRLMPCRAANKKPSSDLSAIIFMSQSTIYVLMYISGCPSIPIVWECKCNWNAIGSGWSVPRLQRQGTPLPTS